MTLQKYFSKQSVFYWPYFSDICVCVCVCDIYIYMSFLWASLVPQTVKNLLAQILDWEDPLEREWLTYSSFFPGEFHGQRSLEGYAVTRSRT